MADGLINEYLREHFIVEDIQKPIPRVTILEKRNELLANLIQIDKINIKNNNIIFENKFINNSYLFKIIQILFI